MFGKDKKDNTDIEVVVKRRKGGIKGRWMRNSLSMVVIILLTLVISVGAASMNYYYSSVRENIVNRTATTANFFNNYINTSYEQFYVNADAYVTDFKEKDKVEVQIIDQFGRILVSSSGLSAGLIPGTNDVDDSFLNNRLSEFIGVDGLSDERVMSVTSPLYYSNGDIIGAVRYVTSLAVVERQIVITIVATTIICLIFFALVYLSNRYFIKSIVEPVLKINIIAKGIAEGRYGMRLHKIHDDEIGELCDTINYMSDEILRAERMKNDFISSVSHELRTPLTSIGGWSETLITGGFEDKEEVSLGLNIIQKESRRLTTMVEELLDFAKIESGRMKLDVGVFDVSEELYEAIFMYSNLIKTGEQGLNFVKGEQDFFINGDKHRLKQVFLNIIDNAAKYGNSDKKIDISITNTGKAVIVKVRDYGVGIPEKELPFVKEKFYKGSSKQRGSGIGLAVTEEIVKMHGGSLDIASREGEGTEVSITLPTPEAHGNEMI